MAEIDVEVMIQLRAGMTTKQAAAVLGATPPTWRMIGQADGTIGVGPSRKADAEGET